MSSVVRWLVVHDLDDACALWLARTWREHMAAADRAALLAVPLLSLALHASFSLRIEGTTTLSCVKLRGDDANERVIDSRGLRGLLWRSRSELQAAGGGSDSDSDSERSYQWQERRALLLAWLEGLGAACANAPRANALAGPSHRTAAWRAQAAQAGLRVWDRADASQAPRQAALLVCGAEVLRVNSRAAPPPSESWLTGVRRLAAGQRCACMLVLCLIDSRGRWYFHGADATPDLRIAGTAAALALGRHLGIPLAAHHRAG